MARFGAGWARRFDGILKNKKKVSVRALADSGDPLNPLAIRLASEIAMGGAVMNAAKLMSEAVQLLILDSPAKSASASAAAGAVWRGGGRRQHVIPAARARDPAPVRPEKTSRTRLAALLRIDPGSEEAASPWPRLARALAALPKPIVKPRWTGEELFVAYDTVSKAADTALAAAAVLKRSPRARIAGHYALVETIDDPFGGAPLLGASSPVLREILSTTPPLAAYVSEDFAAALHAGRAGKRPRVELVGEVTPRAGEPIKLYSLRR